MTALRIRTTVKASTLLRVIVAALASIIVLLNQRQALTIYPALAMQLFAVVMIENFAMAGRRAGLSASKILSALFLVGLISNLSYFRADILTPFEHWARMLFPILLVPLSTFLTLRSPANITVFSAFFVCVALFSIYKIHTVSERLIFFGANSLQTNRGHARHGDPLGI